MKTYSAISVVLVVVFSHYIGNYFNNQTINTMKFVNVDQVKGLEIDTPVFVLDGDTYGFGKLVKIEKTVKGTVRTFEIATFTEPGKPPSINPTTSITVSHVAIIKPRSNGTED